MFNWLKGKRTKLMGLGMVFASVARTFWDVPEEVVTGIFGAGLWFLRDAIGGE